jgi:hypothetical protein
MKKLLILTLLAILLSSCAPASTPALISTATDTPLSTATFTPEPTVTLMPEPTMTFTPEPTATFTPEPTKTQTATPKPPTPTPIKANFLPPVDDKVPQYNAFDLDKAEGIINSNAGASYNGITYQCNGAYFIPGTKDNHFAYDYGTGNCSKHLVGTQVYGMSVGFYGRVISVGNESEKYATKIDYGKIECTDGKVRHIVIQFAHSIPLVEVGDVVDSNTVIAEFEKVSVEIEIMVFGNGSPINPELIGLQPRCPSFCK